MNTKIEEAFVNSYITANKRERLLFELKGKRRTEGIGRFCHHADELIIKSAIKKSGQYILEDLRKMVNSAKDEKCYVISFYEDIDAVQIDKREVLDIIIGRGMPSIAVFDQLRSSKPSRCRDLR